MTSSPLFSGNGMAPPKGMHPVAFVLIFLYIVLVLGVIFTVGVHNIRFVAPGPLLIYLIFRKGKGNDPVLVYLNQAGPDDLIFGFRRKEKTEEFTIDEYSYWYAPCKGMKGRTSDFLLVIKIKTDEQNYVFLTEEKN